MYVDATISKVKDLLSRYVGTHNFHNFTSGTKFEQMASNRFIMSFEVHTCRCVLYTIGLPSLTLSLSLSLCLSPSLSSLVWTAIFGPLYLHHLSRQEGGGVCDAKDQRSKLHAPPDTKDDR